MFSQVVGAKWHDRHVGENWNRAPDPGVAALYTAVEEWWGEEISTALATKASAAPREQLAEFFRWLTESSLTGITRLTLPPMSPGTLRPVVAANIFDNEGFDDVQTALRLLLYTHEVVLEANICDELFTLAHNRHVTQPARLRLQRSLIRLAYLRPFIQQGIVHFNPIKSRSIHPSGMAWDINALANPEIRIIAEELAAEYAPDEEADEAQLGWVLTCRFGALKVGLMSMADGRANPLTRSPAERYLLALLWREIRDERHSLVSSLAQLPVPNFRNDPNLLVKLRRDDDKFHFWRQKLATALAYVSEMPDSADLGEASAIVHAELMSALSDINKSTKKSSVLTTASQGIAQFGIGAIGVVSAGVASGNPMVAGLVGVASAQLAQSVIDNLRGLQAKRSGRLLLALASSFDAAR